MSFDIRLDYRFDTAGFFDVAERRAALEAAAAIWEGLILDEFPDVPAGVELVDVRNPQNRTQLTDVTLTQPIDDLLVFVGTTDLGGALGRAGPTGINAAGDAFNVRIDDNFRGTGPVTDFEPWAGSVSFDPSADWNFDIAGPAPGKPDFLSTAVHEIGHVLGFGTSAIFDQIGAGGFDGPNALAVNGGAPIPLEPDLGHVVDGFAGDSVLMDPVGTFGVRKTPTDIDKALLADIGYEIAGFAKQGSTPAIATDGADGTIFGTIVGDRIDGLGGDDQVQGDAGQDTLSGGAGRDTIFGQDGIDVFGIRPGDDLDRVSDFDLATETLRLIDSGFATAQEALAAVTKPFGNVSQIAFLDGTAAVDVFHASQPGTPLTAANLELQSTQPPDYALAPLDATGPEGGQGETTPFTFEITRSGDIGQPLTVDFQVTRPGVDPVDASDFVGGVLPSGQITIPGGQPSRQITVTIAGDDNVEPDEAFTLRTDTVLGTRTAAGLVLNDDTAPPPPVISIAGPGQPALEGDTGSTDSVFTLTRSGDPGPAVTVDYAVSASSSDPAGPEDFAGGAFPSGQVTLGPGVTEQPLAIALAGDSDPEPDEGFAVSLSNPSAGSLGIASAVAAIANDDALPPGNAPPVAVADSAATFSGTPVTVPVLDNDSDPEGGPLTLVSVILPAGVVGSVGGAGVTVVPPADVSGDIELSYIVADDQGAESEGALTIDVRPQAFPEGVVRGTPQGDPILIGQNAAYIGLGGGDRFVVSAAVEPGGISLVEFVPGDAAQLVPGLEIVGGLLRPDGVALTLANGAQVRLLQADIATFDIGGNATLGRTGTLTDYAGMAESLFGVAPPAPGEAEREVGAATVPDPAALSDGGHLTPVPASARSASSPDSAKEASMEPDLPVSQAPIALVEEAALFFQVGLGRLPNPAGLTFWTEQRLNFEMPGGKPGLDSLGLAREFLRAPEYTGLFGDPDSLSNRAFVESLFRNVLKREGAEGGIDFWTGRLDGTIGAAPASREEVLRAFVIDEPENRSKVPELDRIAFDPTADDGAGQWLFEPDPDLGEAETGTAGADFLRGLGGDDTLSGLDGDDEFFDGALREFSDGAVRDIASGADVYDGGSGQDTLIYEAPREAFTFAADAIDDDVLLVTRDGETDRVTDVETIRFISPAADVGAGGGPATNPDFTGEARLDFEPGDVLVFENVPGSSFVVEVPVAKLLDGGGGGGGGDLPEIRVTAPGDIAGIDGPNRFVVAVDTSGDALTEADFFEDPTRIGDFVFDAVFEDVFGDQVLFVFGIDPVIGGDGAQITLPVAGGQLDADADQQLDFIEIA